MYVYNFCNVCNIYNVCMHCVYLMYVTYVVYVRFVTYVTYVMYRKNQIAIFSAGNNHDVHVSKCENLSYHCYSLHTASNQTYDYFCDTAQLCETHGLYQQNDCRKVPKIVSCSVIKKWLQKN